ncbi:MAG: GerMN domain-containing protein [Spirochaetaceae bacterium]|jgi:hypothetical protein|nr:GerMN domain-containing protein [Spirochaetaceae bacterium]
MPARKRSSYARKAGGRVPRVVLFWTAFFTVIALLFLINIPKITKTWENVFGKRIESQDNLAGVQAPTQIENPSASDSSVPSSIIVRESNGAQRTETFGDDEFAPVSGIEDLLNEDGGLRVEKSASPPGKSAVEDRAGTKEAFPPPAKQASGKEQNPGQQMPAGITQARPERNETPETNRRERTMYLVRVDSAGLVLLSPVKRNVPVNDSPLISTLNILLAGPTAGERQQGLVTLVPDGTRVLGATVDRNVATINFNENFMFNSYGAEGYIAQLKQIIWTATEFPSISEVQILIDGQRIEFLGETIRIDRPRSRASF